MADRIKSSQKSCDSYKCHGMCYRKTTIEELVCGWTMS